MTTFEHELDVCRSAALRAGEIALRYREHGIGYESKSDESPVTKAERECEQVIALAREQAFPEDGLLGEEGAVKASRTGRRWIIDPIDGTRDYVRGVPVWATLIGLEQDGDVVAGDLVDQHGNRVGNGPLESGCLDQDLILSGNELALGVVARLICRHVGFGAFLGVGNRDLRISHRRT